MDVDYVSSQGDEVAINSYKNQETLLRKKREREEIENENILRYENELVERKGLAKKKLFLNRKKRNLVDEVIETEEAFKRTRISCAPCELRMKNDIAALERSSLVQAGHVRLVILGTNAIMVHISQQNYLITVSQRYPFEAPLIRELTDHKSQPSKEKFCIDTTVSNDEENDLNQHLPLLHDWSAVYSLEDLVFALYERSQIKGLFQFEVSKKPPILSSLLKTPIQPPPSLPPPIMPTAFGLYQPLSNTFEEEPPLDNPTSVVDADSFQLGKRPCASFPPDDNVHLISSSSPPASPSYQPESMVL